MHQRHELQGVVGAKRLTPLPDAPVGNHDSQLSQEFLDISKAQSESMIQPYSVADDFRGETVSGVQSTIGFNQPSLRGAGSS